MLLLIIGILRTKFLLLISKSLSEGMDIILTKAHTTNQKDTPIIEYLITKSVQKSKSFQLNSIKGGESHEKPNK